MMIINIHNYAGKGYTKTVELNQTPEKYLLGISLAGYNGPLLGLLKQLYKGQLVTVEQFQISFRYEAN